MTSARWVDTTALILTSATIRKVRRVTRRSLHGESHDSGICYAGWSVAFVTYFARIVLPSTFHAWKRGTSLLLKGVLTFYISSSQIHEPLKGLSGVTCEHPLQPYSNYNLRVEAHFCVEEQFPNFAIHFPAILHMNCFNISHPFSAGSFRCVRKARTTTTTTAAPTTTTTTRRPELYTRYQAPYYQTVSQSGPDSMPPCMPGFERNSLGACVGEFLTSHVLWNRRKKFDFE